MFYINLFLIFSIFGYFFETFIMFLLNKSYNSSVLYGPWTPIYGISILLMILVYLSVKKLKFSKKMEKVLYFLIVTIVLTILEGLSGYIIEITQHKIYWNYDKLIFNIGHYMALEISIIWGVLSLISIYFILPKIKNIVKKIPKVITLVVFGMFIIDVIISAFL